MNQPLFQRSTTALRVPAMVDTPALQQALPTVTHEETPATIDNAAIAAISEDVLGAAKLALTAAIAQPEGDLKGTAEGEVASALVAMPYAQRTGKIAAMQERANAILDTDRKAMVPVFGNIVANEPGGVASGQVRDVLGSVQGGVARAVDVMDLKIEPKHLGATVPTLEIPLTAGGLRFDGGNLVVPREMLNRNLQFNANGALDFESAMADAEQMEEKAPADGVFDQEQFEMVWGESAGPDPYPENEFEAVTDKLRMHVVRVHCVDETNPEWWGNDEIALAGISVDEDGDTKKIGERFVGSGFKDGRSKTLNWSYHMFGLRESHHFPKRYGITFLMAEKDHGGLSSALQKLWQAVKGAVSAAIAKAAAAAGKAIAVFLGIPAAASIIAAAISKAADWIINKLIGWIIGLFKDDIFPAQTAWVTIPSLSARWYYPNGTWGSTWSPLLRKRFRGHGGTYDLYYRWQLYA